MGVESPCSLLTEGERKQQLDFLSPAGLESLGGEVLSYSVSSGRGMSDGLGVGEMGAQLTTKLCAGAWGVQLCLVHLCCS